MAPRLRAPPLLSTFIGLMDLKLGASIITLFALLNKVAGAYGMIVLFTGGSWAQLSFYIYSVGTVAVFFYGLKRIGEEDGARSLIYAHLFAMDHLLNTVYLAYFTLLWYLYTPHDGRRIANSEAQREVMEGGAKVLEGLLTGAAGGEEGRVRAAEMVWSEERGFAGAILLTGWCIKIYFIFCLYSFALHLRRNTYHSLPLSSPSTRRNPRYIPLSRPSYPSSRTGSRAHSPVQSLLPGTLEEIRRSSTPWLGGGEGTGVVPGEEVQLEMESLAKGSGTGMSRAGSNVGAQQRNDLTGGGAGNSIGTIASGGSSSR